MLTRPSVNGDPRQSYASISNRNICGAAGRWLQHHPLVLLSVIFIWIAATRIFYVVLHDPMLGYGNQFDMGRTAACLDLWPNLPGGPRDVAYFEAPIEKHQRIAVASQRCYPSAEALLDWLAIRGDSIRRYFANDTLVDLRSIGLLKALLLTVAACVAHHALRADPRIALVHAAAFMLVMADPVLTLYLNTLYGEFVAALGAYAAITGIVALTLNRRWTVPTLVLFVSGVGCLAFSRLQHVLLPLFFIAMLALLTLVGTPVRRWLRDHFVTCMIIALLSGVSAASIAVNVSFMKANPIFHEVNRNNTLFSALLPAAKQPDALVAALGLPAECAALVYSDFFRKTWRGQSGACPEALAVSPLRVLAHFAYEPRAILIFVGRGILLASAWRMPYVGEVAHAVSERATAGPLLVAASVDALSRTMGYTGHVIFWVTPVVGGLIAGLLLLLPWSRKKDDVGASDAAARSRRAVQLAMFSLRALIVSAWATSLLGDGYSELARHIHLGLVAALAGWVLLIGSAIFARPATMRLWPVLGVAFVVAVPVGMLTTIPVAFGRLAEPTEDAQLATTATFSGFVISPRSVVAIEIEQQSRLLARTDVTPATTLARYHPMNDGRNAFDYTFDRAAMSPMLESGKPISVYAISDDNRRELVDVRHWCVTGRACR